MAAAWNEGALSVEILLEWARRLQSEFESHRISNFLEKVLHLYESIINHWGKNY